MTVEDFPPPVEFMPHDPPMMLIDAVLASDPQSVRCRVRIGEDDPFLRDGRVPGVLVLEYMAQAVGVFSGLRHRAEGTPVRIGYLLSCRNLTVHRDFFVPGDTLEVEARVVWGAEERVRSRIVPRRSAGPRSPRHGTPWPRSTPASRSTRSRRALKAMRCALSSPNATSSSTAATTSPPVTR